MSYNVQYAIMRPAKKIHKRFRLTNKIRPMSSRVASIKQTNKMFQQQQVQTCLHESDMSGNDVGIVGGRRADVGLGTKSHHGI